MWLVKRPNNAAKPKNNAECLIHVAQQKASNTYALKISPVTILFWVNSD